MKEKLKIIIIGGGAAGFFAAIRAAELNPEAKIIILERGRDVLGKVKISGGGRCNVTHACFVPSELVKNYPRGAKELKGPFHKFCCGDTVEWFETRGVSTKIEEDGRMFPISDRSQSIIDCLVTATQQYGIAVKTQHRVDGLIPPSESIPHWQVQTNGQILAADRVMMASGSNPKMWAMLADLGHKIIPPVPSLFTFNIKDKRIEGLPGIAVPDAEVKILNTKLTARGPLLITHWGMSGPAILKLSAWGARALAEFNYRFTIQVNWTNCYEDDIRESLNDQKSGHPKKQIFSNAQLGLPIRLWQRMVESAGIAPGLQWANLGKKQLNALVHEIGQAQFEVNGKSTFKEEFVTAGGVDLKEVDFKTFASKILPGLYFAGEVLNIDAITGGFNFQAAWTGGWIAGEGLSG
ncbi:MAG: flavoprotein [Saprospiraceae bacterium]|nr:MAG: flavoprotein [Saprospiraceae bacterium]